MAIHDDHDAFDSGEILPDVALGEILKALAIPGIGRVTARRVLETFSSVAKARQASDEALLGLGLKASALRALRKGEAAFDPEEEMARARTRGIELVPVNDVRYPAAVRRLHDAPLLLYVMGTLLERDALAVAVVGSRRASVYGCMQAQRLAGDLARAGFTVVSGFARGIDSVAHEAALTAGGRTLAVLGNGLGHVYPRENESLAERVAAGGALISELPLDTIPAAANFPPRNRLIAALSLGVLVVEASQRSGALITARLAGEMGKEVFAVPGDIGRPQVRGSHQLIRDGAKLVEAVDDILEELGPLPQPVRVAEDAAPMQDPRVVMLNDRERRLYDLLGGTPKSIDDITRASGMAPANVASLLTVLEVKRLAVQKPGKLYVRAGSLTR